jgi:hypothetical protein
MVMFFTFIGSLTIALFAVWVSLRCSAKEKDKRILTALRNELIVNETICKQLCDKLSEESQALDWGREDELKLTPYPQLQTWAGDIAKLTIILNNHPDAFGKLQATYIAADIVNRHIQRIEEIKYGAIITIAKADVRGTRIRNCIALKNYIMEPAMSALTEARSVIDKELSRYKWWRFK